VSGQKGIHDTTMLLRRSPFGEWVVVYYDPEQTSEAKILKRVRTNGCRNAAIVRAKKKSTTMNPFVAAGDCVQLRLILEEKTSLTISKIPTGWKFEGKLKDLPAGEHYLNIYVPKGAQQKRSQIVLQTDRSKSFTFSAEVVGLVPG